MTNKEIIETLTLALTEVEWNYPMDYSIAILEAIKAVENKEKYQSAYKKSTPKKTIQVTNSDISLLPRCPTCKCSVNYNQEYCSICGQHLAPIEDFDDLINEL